MALVPPAEWDSFYEAGLATDLQSLFEPGSDFDPELITEWDSES